MAVPKKRVSRTRKYLRNTNWKKDILQEVVRSFSAAVSLGKNPTRLNRGRFSKERNRRDGFGVAFGFAYDTLSAEQEADALVKKAERITKTSRSQSRAKPRPRPEGEVVPNTPQDSESGDSSVSNDSNPET